MTAITSGWSIKRIFSDDTLHASRASVTKVHHKCWRQRAESLVIVIGVSGRAVTGSSSGLAANEETDIFALIKCAWHHQKWQCPANEDRVIGPPFLRKLIPANKRLLRSLYFNSLQCSVSVIFYMFTVQSSCYCTELPHTSRKKMTLCSSSDNNFPVIVNIVLFRKLQAVVNL